MKTYIAYYESPGNLDKGELVIRASRPSEASTKFFDWLKEQPLYEHMWNLNMSIREIKPTILE